MRILEVHEANYLTKPIFEFIEIPEELSLRGHDVTMVDYGERDKKIFSLKTKRFRGHRVFPDAKVKIIRPGAIYLGELVTRFTGMIASWFVLRQLFKEKKFDAVLLYSVPTNGWITLHFAKKHKVPVFFRTLDALRNLRNYPFPLKYIVGALENHVYKHSDHILSLTPRLGAYTGRKDCLPLYPAVNDKLFYPLPKDDAGLESLRNKYGISKEDKIILYLGTFYDFGGLEVFIKNIRKIQRSVPNARLLLVGGGFVEKELKELAEKEKVSADVIFTGFVPYSEVTNHINLATLCINAFRECDATKDIIPAKLFQYMACKRPLLSRRLKGTMDLIPERSGAVKFVSTDKELVDNTIELLSDEKMQHEIAEKGYEFVMKNHAWPAFIDKLEGYLKKYTNNKN
ncbi:MAG: glycosyltransferase [Candidatus Woesearchaeota archaeon]